MHRERGVESEARLVRRTGSEQNFREVQHRGEVARLELERAADVVQALAVAVQEVVERRALVSGFGEIGRAPQEQHEAGFGDVVATRGDVARGEVERARGLGVRMVHPHAPDLVFGGRRFRGLAPGEPPEQRIEEGKRPSGPAGSPPRNESEDVALVDQQ